VQPAREGGGFEPIGQQMQFERGETVEWIIEDKANLVLHRLKVPLSAMKKKHLG